VVVSSFDDAGWAVWFNFNLQACVIRRDNEAALTLYRFDEHGSHIVGPDLGLNLFQRSTGRLPPGHCVGVAERIRHWYPVDLRGERPESLFVGHVLRGQSHGEVGAPVVRVVKDDQRLANDTSPRMGEWL
jgi:hypothetical protein